MLTLYLFIVWVYTNSPTAAEVLVTAGTGDSLVDSTVGELENIN